MNSSNRSYLSGLDPQAEIELRRELLMTAEVIKLMLGKEDKPAFSDSAKAVVDTSLARAVAACHLAGAGELAKNLDRFLQYNIDNNIAVPSDYTPIIELIGKVISLPQAAVVGSNILPDVEAVNKENAELAAAIDGYLSVYKVSGITNETKVDIARNKLNEAANKVVIRRPDLLASVSDLSSAMDALEDRLGLLGALVDNQGTKDIYDGVVAAKNALITRLTNPPTSLPEGPTEDGSAKRIR